MNKSHSYPKNLKEAYKYTIDSQKETIQQYKIKDQKRAQYFADIGSPSSSQIPSTTNWKIICCNTLSKMVNYMLEQEEETQRQDEEIRKKSYAGFYYFIKWFIRALFFLIFSTLGTIAGKEIGCEIKDHESCKAEITALIENSPHLVATILGMIFGLIIGQWLGRIVWDSSIVCFRRILRKLEKIADKSKAILILFSFFIYLIITSMFTVIFYFFVKIGHADHNLIGCIIGGFLGLLLAIFAYRKASSCRNGEMETPIIVAQYNNIEPPELIV